MRKNNFDNNEYWNNKYLLEDTKWDIGEISPPLKEYFDQLTNKDLKILIPGAGNAYEAEYLFKLGFNNTFIMDWSEIALQNFMNRIPQFPKSNILKQDFFSSIGEYDLIIEQTFFCSFHPEKRKIYSEKVFELLKKNGKLVGLLFDREFIDGNPPFGGNKLEYMNYFSSGFRFKVFETAYNSIMPRFEKEIFMILEVKK